MRNAEAIKRETSVIEQLHLDTIVINSTKCGLKDAPVEWYFLAISRQSRRDSCSLATDWMDWFHS
jgi:hypothetical protein